jgi:hypothetical protein
MYRRVQNSHRISGLIPRHDDGFAAMQFTRSRTHKCYRTMGTENNVRKGLVLGQHLIINLVLDHLISWS